jgi:hypothetical protein
MVEKGECKYLQKKVKKKLKKGLFFKKDLLVPFLKNLFRFHLNDCQN